MSKLSNGFKRNKLISNIGFKVSNVGHEEERKFKEVPAEKIEFGKLSQKVLVLQKKS